MAVFRQGAHFSKISLYIKFLYVKTVRERAVRDSLAICAKWLVVDFPFYLEFRPKLTHSHKKRALSNIPSYIASAVTHNEKVHRKSATAFSTSPLR